MRGLDEASPAELRRLWQPCLRHTAGEKGKSAPGPEDNAHHGPGETQGYSGER